MKYSIYKEDLPIHTIEKIKSILDSLKIKTEEIIFPTNISPNSKQFASIPTVSLTIKITQPNINYSVNGKGTSLENARASGYAELMERLQNFCNSPLFTPSLYVDKKEINDLSFMKNNKTLKKYFTEKMKVKAFTQNINEHLFLPYFNINDKQVYYLPGDIISFTQGSHGMAAGNTFEEAFVQGLSEICERYAVKEVFRKKLSLPDIPKEEYKKYDNIKNALAYYKKNGFEVYIKDASLGGKVPVVCSIFKKDNVLGIIFGAQPSLPVAIERTLTEFAQGQNISEFSEKGRGFPFYSKVKYSYCSGEDLIHTITHSKCIVEENSDFNKMFLNKKTSYEFSKSSWISDDKKNNNKLLLNFIINKIKEAVTPEIYIRNVAFLGFPAIQIFIPEMSEIKPYTNDFCYNHVKLFNWLNYNGQKEYENLYNVNTLFDIAKQHTFSHIFWERYKNYFDAPFEYIAFLCAVLLKDCQNVEKYKNITVAQNKYRHIFTEEQIHIIEMLGEYFALYKKKKDEQFIKKELEKKYKKREVKSVIKLINELTFDDVVDITIAKKSKKKIYINRFIQRLIKIQSKTMPNQTDLEKYFK